MSLEFRVNIFSRFKQGHEFENVLPLAYRLVSPLSLQQHRLCLENVSPRCLHCFVLVGPESGTTIGKTWFQSQFNCCWFFFPWKTNTSPGHLLL